MAYELGLVWSDEETRTVLAAVDEDGSGTIDYGEFQTWFDAHTTDMPGKEPKGGMQAVQLRAKLAARCSPRGVGGSEPSATRRRQDAS